MEDSQNKPSPPYKPFWSLLAHLFIGGLAGAILVCLGYAIASQDSFIRWERLPSPPQTAVEVVSADNYQLAVRTASGEVYIYDRIDKDWNTGITPTEEQRQDCQNFPTAFKQLAHPPENQLDCAAFSGMEHEYSYTQLYAVDAQGEVWNWRTESSGLVIFAYVMLAFRGLLGGLFVGIILWAVQHAKRSLTSADPSEVQGE